MPLYNGKEVKLVAHPSDDITPSTKVFQIRFTGEIFTDFEEYSNRLDFYRVPNFACKYTGKSGFAFEGALEHEQETKRSITSQLPSAYVRVILTQTQFSQLNLTQLVNKAYDACVAEYNRQHNLSAPATGTASKSSSKYPFKKTLIKTQIRISAKQEHFKNAPWIVHEPYAREHNIETEMPAHLKTLIAESKKIKTAKTKKTTKTTKTQKNSIGKSEAVAAMNQKPTKSLKYPCDDQLLLLHDKIAAHKLAEFDSFWTQISRIGSNSNASTSGDGDTANDASSNTNRAAGGGAGGGASNVAFIEFNNTYTTAIDGVVDTNTLTLAHRQLNHVFNRAWTLWTFVQVYHEALQITPFPLSYLLDSLCYDKRCILLDELHCCLLEVIRQHCVRCVEQRVERQKHNKLKRIKERQRKLKAAKQKQQQRKQQQVRSQKEEADASEDDDDDDDEEQEEEDEDEDSEATSEEDSESSSEQDSDEEDEEDAMSIADIEVDVDALQWTEMAVFGDGDDRISSFKLDLLRAYLQLRCSQVKNDDDDDMDVEEKDDDDDDDDTSMAEAKESPVKSLLPECEYSLHDEIWANLTQIRHFVTLGIEHKLDILRVLLTDALRSKIVSEWTQHRVDEYQRVKQQVKTLDDKQNEVVKREKQKLRQIRTQLLEKKKSVKTSKSGATTPGAGAAASSSSSSGSSSASGSKSNSVTNSPPNKENNGSRGNSESVSECTLSTTTSVKDEIEALKQQEKRVQSEQNEMLRQQELQLRYKKHALYAQCCTHLTELGTDRFHNKYFWTFYTDGRIFVYHANTRFHQVTGTFDTRRMIEQTMHNNVKCCNEWEQIPMPNEFCWSVIATTTQFYQLLACLDERGSREHELLRTLQALKSDIVQCMRLHGNDDFDEDTVSTSTMSESTAATDELPSTDSKQTGRRRSKRVLKKGGARTRTRNDVAPYVQFAEKNYLSYKNYAKRK